MLSSRLLPANTPRQRLSMARDATLRVRLGLRGQGISCTNFHCPCLAENRGGVGFGWKAVPLLQKDGKEMKAFTPNTEFGGLLGMKRRGRFQMIQKRP